MQQGMFFSSLLHVGVVILLVFGLPSSPTELVLGGGSTVPVVFESDLEPSESRTRTTQLPTPDEPGEPADQAEPDTAEATTPAEPQVEEAGQPEEATLADTQTEAEPTAEQTPSEPEQPAAADSPAAEPAPIDLAVLSQSQEQPEPGEPPASDQLLTVDSPLPPATEPAETLEQQPVPDLPEGPSAEVVPSPVTQQQIAESPEPVEEISPEPLESTVTSPTVTESPSPDAPPVPEPQISSPPSPAETPAPEPDRIALESTDEPEPEPLPDDTVEEVQEQQEPVEAAAAGTPTPPLPAPEQEEAPPATQVASVPDRATAPTPAAPTEAGVQQTPQESLPPERSAPALPLSKPDRDVTLPETPQSEPEETQTASSSESRPASSQPSDSGQQENAADDLIASLAQGGNQSAAASGSGGRQGGGGGYSRLSSVDERKIVRAVGRYWNVTCGQRGIEDVVVEIRLEMTQDKRVADFEFLNLGRYNSDPVYRDVADRAKRAIYQAQPLPFPDGKYNQWRNVKMNFPAREVCG